MDKKEELKVRIKGVDASLKYFEQEKNKLEAELKELEQQLEEANKTNLGDIIEIQGKIIVLKEILIQIEGRK